jgi:hypothetical protein
MEKSKMAEFLSAQLSTLKNENRIGRLHLTNADPHIKEFAEKIILAIADEIWT